MVFIETPVFTRQVTELLTDDEYGQFQQCLAAHPKMGYSGYWRVAQVALER
jgi:hypothetical protein